MVSLVSLLLVVAELAALESGRCSHGQLEEVLVGLEGCRREHRWIREFCGLHQEAQNSLSLGREGRRRAAVWL